MACPRRATACAGGIREQSARFGCDPPEPGRPGRRSGEPGRSGCAKSERHLGPSPTQRGAPYRLGADLHIAASMWPLPAIPSTFVHIPWSGQGLPGQGRGRTGRPGGHNRSNGPKDPDGERGQHAGSEHHLEEWAFSVPCALGNSRHLAYNGAEGRGNPGATIRSDRLVPFGSRGRR